MHRVMGQGWSQRRITVTRIDPENTSLSPRTFDVGTDEDLKDEIAAVLGITRDVLVTRHNAHNGLRFFYLDRPLIGRGPVRNDLAQGLMRKGDKNRDAPIIRGPCYVCKQCTERDAFASCFPEDFDVITGRSRVTAAAEHLLVLGDLEEQTGAKKAKHEPSLPAPRKAEEEPPKKEEQEPHTIEISGVVVNEEDLLAAGSAAPSDFVTTAPQDAVAAVTVPDVPTTTMTVMAANEQEESALPAKLAPLRDMVYCQILLGGIKGNTVASMPKMEEEKEEPQAVVEHVSPSSPSPPPHPPVVDVVTAVTTTTSSPQPETDDVAVVEKPKKTTRRGRRNDVCADNIVPEGVRRSARLRK